MAATTSLRVTRIAHSGNCSPSRGWGTPCTSTTGEPRSLDPFGRSSALWKTARTRRRLFDDHWRPGDMAGQDSRYGTLERGLPPVPFEQHDRGRPDGQPDEIRREVSDQRSRSR